MQPQNTIGLRMVPSQTNLWRFQEDLPRLPLPFPSSHEAQTLSHNMRQAAPLIFDDLPRISLPAQTPVFRCCSSKVGLCGQKAVRLTPMTAHNGPNANMPSGVIIAPSQEKVIFGGSTDWRGPLRVDNPNAPKRWSGGGVGGVYTSARAGEDQQGGANALVPLTSGDNAFIHYGGRSPARAVEDQQGGANALVPLTKGDMLHVYMSARQVELIDLRPSEPLLRCLERSLRSNPLHRQLKGLGMTDPVQMVGALYDATNQTLSTGLGQGLLLPTGTSGLLTHTAQSSMPSEGSVKVVFRPDDPTQAGSLPSVLSPHAVYTPTDTPRLWRHQRLDQATGAPHGEPSDVLQTQGITGEQ
jgi:hypothetical protein